MSKRFLVLLTTLFKDTIQNDRNIFTWMEYKHNSMCLSCKCRPAVVEFRVTTGIPELNINFGHPVFHFYILKIGLVETKDFLIKPNNIGMFTVFACH